jgi:beta-glucanase (GH16 family)
MNERLLVTYVALLAAFVLSTTASPALEASEDKPPALRNQEGWKVVFFDDFEGDSLDLTKWNCGYPWGPTHNHRAYMSPANVIVENGLLRLKAENRRHPEAPQSIVHGGEVFSLDYTSGVVTTRDRFEFTYGYVEARIKVPKTKGFWPAFWTLNSDGAWPPEIDIMEILTKEPDVLHTNYHYGLSWNNRSSFYQKTKLRDFSEDFHTFAVKWTESEMAWYVNGIMIGQKFYDRRWIAQSKDNYILINLAVGGWGGDPDDTTEWPGYYDIDWVRVWQKDVGGN